MDVKASEQLERPREHTINKIIMEMLTHINPLERQDLSVEQLEAIRAVLPTVYSITNAEKAIDDTGKLADLNSALLQQDVMTIRVLDDLCVKFVKELIFENGIGKTNRSSAKKELVSASQAYSTTGLHLQGLNSRESRVSKSIKQIELQLQATVSADQPLAGVGSLLKLKSESLARVGSPQSKVQKSLPKSDTPGNASMDPSSIDLSQSNTSRTPPEPEAPASTPTGPQIPEQSILEPDVPANLDQDYAEQLGIGLSPPKTSGTPPESEAPASTLTGTQSLEQNLSKPGVSESPKQDDAEQLMPDPIQEEEKALQASTPISASTTSQIPLPISRKKSQISPPTSASNGFSSKKSGIPRLTEASKP